jgi:hypothetical protein
VSGEWVGPCCLEVRPGTSNLDRSNIILLSHKLYLQFYTNEIAGSYFDLPQKTHKGGMRLNPMLSLPLIETDTFLSTTCQNGFKKRRNWTFQFTHLSELALAR